MRIRWEEPMGRPAYTETLGESPHWGMQNAERVAEQLALGNQVPPDEPLKAAEAMVNMMWAGQPVERVNAERVLVRIYQMTNDDALRGEILGELLGMGPSASELLTSLVKSATFLTGSEGQELVSLLGKPLTDRLRVVAEWLYKSDGHQPRDEGRHLIHDPDDFDDRRRSLESDPERKSDFPGGVDPPVDPQEGIDAREAELHNILKTPGLPEEDRLRAAQQLGTSSVSLLIGILHSEEAGEHEF